MAVSGCGLTFERTVEIIKNNVLTGNYNGRTEVMKGLQKDGFSYSEAKEVTDYYFKIYKRVAAGSKQSTVAPMDAKQKTEKMMNNLAVDYLRGETGGIPMSDADLDALKKIYEKADKADTPTLKERFNEEANAFVHSFLPTYANELFRSSVYARPLLSSVFFIKSLLSNFHAIIERSITDSIYDGKKMDLRWLTRFSGLGNKAFGNVLTGGVPATNLYQNEQTTFGGSRLEEFPVKGTNADSTVGKRYYFGIMKFLTKWSNRFNAAPDTRGIYINAERHMYQLLKEKYRDLGMSNDDATTQAMKDMELDDINTAELMAENKFAELGIPFRARNGKLTSEAKVAVAEYRRMKRDNVLWEKALQLGKNDFWKRNMTVESELGFGDHGLFGLKARLLSALRNKLESKTKSKTSSVFNLWAFGFLNGAANFAEDAIERFPAYALIKISALQSKKGKVSDKMLRNDIFRRQKDIIVKNLTTAMFFVGMKMLEDLICPDRDTKPSSKDISKGFVQFGPCGIPAIVPPQMYVMYKVYNVVDNATSNGEDFFNTILNILPVMVQGNNMGLGGTMDRLVTNTSDLAVAKSRGDEIRQDEIKSKMIKDATRAAADFANGYLPWPSRLTSEAGTAAQKIIGMGQKQQSLPFAIDEVGKPLGVWNTVGKMSIANLGNVTGISEILTAAFGANKNYAVDWQGRKVAHYRGSDIIGSGIRYEAADDILAEAGVATPYIARNQRLEVSAETEDVTGFLSNTVSYTKKVDRYMTDEEFFNVSVALGNFNKEFFDEHGDKMIDLIKENKSVAQKQIKSVFDRTKETALEAMENGITNSGGILEYVKENWKTKRKQKVTETVFE